MDLETTFSTIEAYLPAASQGIRQTASYLPEQLTGALKHAVSYLPAEIDFMNTALFILFFTAASLIFGVLGRVVLGKRSSLNHSLSSTIGILFIYVLTIIVYTFKPWELHDLLSPLPFVSFNGEYLAVMPISNLRFPMLCSEVLALVILAFLVNLLDSMLPRGKHFLSWYLMRFMTVVASMLLHFMVRRALHTYLPEFLVTYAPAALLILLAFMLLSGIVNLILGMVISIADPFLGAMYTFFFSTVVGKQLSKAIFSSAILCAIVYLLEYFGYTVLSITAGALLAYVPLVLVLLALWYLIGHIL